MFLAGGGFLGLYIRVHVTILMTSFIGSYLLVRSVSFFISSGKYFPNEFTLVKQLEARSFEFPAQFYLFIIGIIGMFVLGSIV